MSEGAGPGDNGGNKREETDQGIHGVIQEMEQLDLNDPEWDNFVHWRHSHGYNDPNIKEDEVKEYLLRVLQRIKSRRKFKIGTKVKKVESVISILLPQNYENEEDIANDEDSPEWVAFQAWCRAGGRNHKPTTVQQRTIIRYLLHILRSVFANTELQDHRDLDILQIVFESLCGELEE